MATASASNRLRRCPHCQKVGTRITDIVVVQGVAVDSSYCGVCGGSWPAPAKKGKPKS